MQEVIIKVEGMMCGNCKAAVEKACHGIKGVESVEVDLDAGTAAIQFDETAASAEQFRTAIEDLGYDAAL